MRGRINTYFQVREADGEIKNVIHGITADFDGLHFKKGIIALKYSWVVNEYGQIEHTTLGTTQEYLSALRILLKTHYTDNVSNKNFIVNLPDLIELLEIRSCGVDMGEEES